MPIPIGKAALSSLHHRAQWTCTDMRMLRSLVLAQVLPSTSLEVCYNSSRICNLHDLPTWRRWRTESLACRSLCSEVSSSSSVRLTLVSAHLWVKIHRWREDNICHLWSLSYPIVTAPYWPTTFWFYSSRRLYRPASHLTRRPCHQSAVLPGECAIAWWS